MASIKMLVKKIIILFITYHAQCNAYKLQAEDYFVLDIIIGTLYFLL